MNPCVSAPLNDAPAIVGVYEHPTRYTPDKSIVQLHAECARGALEDAGLTLADVDGYFCSADAPGSACAPIDWRKQVSKRPFVY